MLKQLSAFNCDAVSVQKEQRLARQSGSRGNQLKWVCGDTYVKLDCLGYEGLAEFLVTKLLECTDIKDFVKYTKCKIFEDGTFLGNGCMSMDFLQGYEEVTFGQILDSNLIGYSASYDEVRDVILDETGVDVKKYVDQILCLDAITANDDRHFNNFALLRGNDGSYKTAPIFDNGAALLSDVISYPMSAPLLENLKKVQAKPFSIDFLRQLNFVTPITLDPDKFFASVCAVTEEEKRALDVLEYRINVTRGIAWQK